MTLGNMQVSTGTHGRSPRLVTRVCAKVISGRWGVLLHVFCSQSVYRKQTDNRSCTIEKKSVVILFLTWYYCVFFLFFVKIGTLLVTGGCYSNTFYNVALKPKVKMLLVTYLLWTKTQLYFLYKGRDEKVPEPEQSPVFVILLPF